MKINILKSIKDFCLKEEILQRQDDRAYINYLESLLIKHLYPEIKQTNYIRKKNNNNKAIVSLAIGDLYKNSWYLSFKESWEKYCDLYGYDLIVFGEYLDSSEKALNKSPAWQKLLTLKHEIIKDYKQVVWVDSDIMINYKNAPDISEGVPQHKIGIIKEYGDKENDLFWGYWQKKPLNKTYTQFKHPNQKYFDRSGIKEELNKIYNTGVMVCNPNIHGDLFLETYNKYEQIPVIRRFEQPFLNLELQKKNLIYELNPKFNVLLIHLLNHLDEKKSNLTIQKQILKENFQNSYFFHLAGELGEVKRRILAKELEEIIA